MVARSGAELWHELIEVAGLQPETSYDRDIVDQVGRRLWVHRHDRGEPEACEPRVVLSADGSQQSFECPPGRGSWWCVVELDGAIGEAFSLEGVRYAALLAILTVVGGAALFDAFEQHQDLDFWDDIYPALPGARTR